ncbi:MAG: hypothetical protein FWE54_02665 [Methanimicrococcus sp.]|nr:hypothetical protein [Methanimicrococcus sp.]
MKSRKALFITALSVLLVLIAAVSFSGCLGSNNNDECCDDHDHDHGHGHDNEYDEEGCDECDEHDHEDHDCDECDEHEHDDDCDECDDDGNTPIYVSDCC